jgi:hypothetical protein
VSLALAAAFLPRHQIDDVVKVSLPLGVGGRIFAGQDPHEANVVGAVAQDLERLHKTSEPVALDAHLLLDLGSSEGRARILDRRRLGGRSFRRRRLGGRRFGRRTIGRRRLGLARNAFCRGLGRSGLRLCRRSLRLGSPASRLDVRLSRGRLHARLDGRDGLGGRRAALGSRGWRLGLR